ncbi:MAG TPA: AAC(3) family N-acetyltransferase [Anaerolineaceae bacterium]|jgi:aminoglycoside 3-N-acetyltransferase
MSESSTIPLTPKPRTRESLTADLRRVGIKAGMVLNVHSSLSSLGWVSGGPVTVVQALMDVITPQGTLVMPTHSGDLSDPAKWANPPVPESWVAPIRASMPAYDPRYTPSRGMGRIPETFRTFPGVLRSGHPAVSFAAWGAQAEFITHDHRLEYCLGEHSPLARLYDLDAWVLLLGVGYDHNTAFHLSEYRADNPLPSVEGAPIFEDGRRIWKEYPDIEVDSEPFPEIGAELDWSAKVLFGEVGSAQARLFHIREAVDFAQAWITRLRGEKRRV